MEANLNINQQRVLLALQSASQRTLNDDGWVATAEIHGWVEHAGIKMTPSGVANSLNALVRRGLADHRVTVMMGPELHLWQPKT